MVKKTRKSVYNKLSKKSSRKPRSADMVIVRGPNPFPDKYMCTMTYTSVNPYSVTLGSTASRVWKFNNLHDLDFTGGGHQPYGYDQITALYHRWIVFGCAYEITACNCADNVTWDIGTIFTTASLTPSNPDVIQEFPYAKYGIGEGNNTGDSKVVLRDSITTKKLVGLSKIDARNTSYSGSVVGAPGEDVFLSTFVNSYDRASSTSIRITTKLRLQCMFFDRKTLTQS